MKSWDQTEKKHEKEKKKSSNPVRGATYRAGNKIKGPSQNLHGEKREEREKGPQRGKILDG